MTFPYGLLQDPNAMLQQSLQQSLLAPAPTPAPAPEPPSFGERVATGARRLLDGARTALNPVPPGYENLLTPEEMRAARPSLLGSLIAAPDAPSYGERLDAAVMRKQAGEQLALQRAQAERLAAARAAIAERFAEPAGETQEARQLRLQDMFAAYVAAGDTEMAGKMAEVVKSLGPVRASAGAARNLMQVDAGDRIELRDALDGTLVQTVPKAETTGQRTAAAQTEASLRRQQLDLQNTLAAAFERNPTIRNGREIARAISTARGSLAQNTPIADLNSIVSLTKIFDPGSVAREGEVHLTISAASLPQRLQVLIQQANSGNKLTPAQRRNMELLIEEIEASTRALIEPVQAQFGQRVRQANTGAAGLLMPIDSAAVAPDPLAGLRAPGAGLLRTPTSPTPGGRNRIDLFTP